VAQKLKKSFTVAIVPFTFENTNLRYKKVGDFVNLEVDILARYVDSVLNGQNSESKLKRLLDINW